LYFFRSGRVKQFGKGQPAIRSNAAACATSANSSGSITTAIGAILEALVLSLQGLFLCVGNVLLKHPCCKLGRDWGKVSFLTKK